MDSDFSHSSVMWIKNVADCLPPFALFCQARGSGGPDFPTAIPLSDSWQDSRLFPDRLNVHFGHAADVALLP